MIGRADVGLRQAQWSGNTSISMVKISLAGLPSRPAVRRRSKRLEKKLRIRAFQEYGFEVSFRLSSSLSPSACDTFWTSFIGELIEARRLAFGGGERGYVTRAGTGSATEADRVAVAAWLENRPGVERVTVGPLEDAWYGPCADRP
jgi:uncharacterized protein YggL (DUF469 family)